VSDILLQRKRPKLSTPDTDEEAYQVWNMGIGYCIYSPAQFGEIITSMAEGRGMRCYALGQVVEGRKKVIIKPKGIVYK